MRSLIIIMLLACQGATYAQQLILNSLPEIHSDSTSVQASLVKPSVEHQYPPNDSLMSGNKNWVHG